MYELYIANKNYSSWSLRPWVLMTTLGIPFTEHLVPFSAGHNWQAFRRFSPNGKVPCLVADGQAVWDSLAITEYLAERHTAVWPDDGQARAWARCAAAEMHSGFTALRGQCPMSVGVRVQLHQITPALARDIARVDELWSEGLQRFGGPFLAGERFTAIDAFFAPVAFRIQTYGLNFSKVSVDYAARLLALDSMKRWTAAALAEPWRDPEHEEEAAELGVQTADLRAPKVDS